MILKMFSLLHFYLTTFENDALFFIIKYVRINQLLSKTMQNNRIISSNIMGQYHRKSIQNLQPAHNHWGAHRDCHCLYHQMHCWWTYNHNHNQKPWREATGHVVTRLRLLPSELMILLDWTVRPTCSVASKCNQPLQRQQRHKEPVAGCSDQHSLQTPTMTSLSWTN